MHNPNTSTEDRALDLEGVCKVTSLAQPTIYRRVALGTFPPPQKIGRKNIWMHSTILRWLHNLPTKQVGGKRGVENG